MAACDVCGDPLPPQKRGRPRRTCSQRCHNWKQNHPGELPRWLTGRTCGYCGIALVSPDLRAKFCGEICRRRAGSGSSVGKQRQCGACGDQFVVRNGKQRYCSKRCRIRANRRWGSSTALRRQAEARGADRGERFTLLDVCARDGWVCGLCLGPIDPAVVGDRYWEGTVDHIIPITRGGEHALENAQPAHWTCNSAKRNSVDIAVMSVPGPWKRVIARWPAVDQPPRTRTVEHGRTGTPSRRG